MPINYHDYHPKWSLIRRLILKRAGNRCEECGVENGTEIKSKGIMVWVMGLFNFFVLLKHVHPGSYIVKLNVAHLNRNRTINRFWNLKALCQRCHLKHDRSQILYSIKYGKETQYINGKLFLDESTTHLTAAAGTTHPAGSRLREMHHSNQRHEALPE